MKDSISICDDVNKPLTPEEIEQSKLFIRKIISKRLKNVNYDVNTIKYRCNSNENN